MQSKWWLAGVLVIAVVLAILLFPKPETGPDLSAIPTAQPPARQAVAKTPSGRDIVEIPRISEHKGNPDEALRGNHNPEAAARDEARRTGVGQVMAHSIGSLAAIKFALNKYKDDEGAEALKAEISVVQRDIQARRRKMEDVDEDELKEQMLGIVATIEQTEYVENPQIKGALTRITGLFE